MPYQITQHKKIVDDTWRLFEHFMAKPNLDAAAKYFTRYEELYKGTPLWEFAGRECAAKLQELEKYEKHII